MRVQVTQVKDVKSGDVPILFQSPYGHASAQWVGTSPLVGNEYEVEIEISATLNWNAEISESPTCDVSIFEDGDQICIIGHLQSIGADGVAVIQFGSDVILVEVNGAPNPFPINVLLKIPLLKLFDTHF